MTEPRSYLGRSSRCLGLAKLRLWYPRRPRFRRCFSQFEAYEISVQARQVCNLISLAICRYVTLTLQEASHTATFEMNHCQGTLSARSRTLLLVAVTPWRVADEASDFQQPDRIRHAIAKYLISLTQAPIPVVLLILTLSISLTHLS
jgi:hypothetical protein